MEALIVHGIVLIERCFPVSLPSWLLLVSASYSLLLPCPRSSASSSIDQLYSQALRLSTLVSSLGLRASVFPEDLGILEELVVHRNFGSSDHYLNSKDFIFELEPSFLLIQTIVRKYALASCLLGRSAAVRFLKTCWN